MERWTDVCVSGWVLGPWNSSPRSPKPRRACPSRRLRPLLPQTPCSFSSPRPSATSTTSHCARSRRSRAPTWWLCEDTRTTGKLFQHFGIDTPRVSFHIHNEHGRVAQMVQRMQDGDTVALVSDAGTPSASPTPASCSSAPPPKPTSASRRCPGPTAFVPALVASGLPTDRFVFEGFLPHKKGRQTRLKAQSREETRTTVLYESPHRLVKLLGQLAEHCGADRPAAVAREISKLHEETRRGTLAELEAHYGAQPKVRGEIVVVVGGRPLAPPRQGARHQETTRQSAPSTYESPLVVPERAVAGHRTRDGGSQNARLLHLRGPLSPRERDRGSACIDGALLSFERWDGGVRLGLDRAQCPRRLTEASLRVRHPMP